MGLSSPKSVGDILGPADVLGHLLVCIPTEYVEGIVTVHSAKNGPQDAVRVDVAVLTAQNADGSHGVVYRDVLWFNAFLRSALRKQLGDTVLARMGQGTAKPGQDAPYLLQDAMNDAQAVAFAEQWLAQHPEFEAVAAKSMAGAANISAPAPAVAAPPAAAPIPSVPATPAAAPIPAQAAVPSVPGTVAGPNLGANAAVPQPTQVAAPAADPAALLGALSPAEQQQLLALMQQQAAATAQ